MPIQTDNAIMAGVRGALGKQVVFRQRNGKVIVSAYPNMKDRVLTQKQLKVNETMKEANKYVKVILADERSRNEAQVRLDVPSNRLYTALIKEYYANHYTPEETIPAPTPTREEEVKNFDFMKYLLENTEKSIAEIHRLTGIKIDEIEIYQDKYRIEKPIIFPLPTEEKKG